MEEKVGELWHRLIIRAARTRYPQAAFTLSQMNVTVGALFRALGDNRGLQVQAAQASEHGASQAWAAAAPGRQRKNHRVGLARRAVVAPAGGHRPVPRSTAQSATLYLAYRPCGRRAKEPRALVQQEPAPDGTDPAGLARSSLPLSKVDEGLSGAAYSARQTACSRGSPGTGGERRALRTAGSSS